MSDMVGRLRRKRAPQAVSIYVTAWVGTCAAFAWLQPGSITVAVPWSMLAAVAVCTTYREWPALAAVRR